MSTAEEALASDWNGVAGDIWWRVLEQNGKNEKRKNIIQKTVNSERLLHIYNVKVHQHSKLMFMYVTTSNTYFWREGTGRLLHCAQKFAHADNLAQKDTIIMVRVYWTIHNESSPCFVVRLLHTLNPPNLDMEEFCTTRNSRRITPKRLFFTTKKYPFEQNVATKEPEPQGETKQILEPMKKVFRAYYDESRTGGGRTLVFGSTTGGGNDEYTVINVKRVRRLKYGPIPGRPFTSRVEEQFFTRLANAFDESSYERTVCVEVFTKGVEWTMAGTWRTELKVENKQFQPLPMNKVVRNIQISDGLELYTTTPIRHPPVIEGHNKIRNFLNEKEKWLPHGLVMVNKGDINSNGFVFGLSKIVTRIELGNDIYLVLKRVYTVSRPNIILIPPLDMTQTPTFYEVSVESAGNPPPEIFFEACTRVFLCDKEWTLTDRKWMDAYVREQRNKRSGNTRPETEHLKKRTRKRYLDNVQIRL